MKISNEEYLKRVTAVNPTIKVIGKYTSSQNNIEVQCKNCGHIWFPNARHISRSRTICEVCNKEKLLHDLKQKVQEINPNIEIRGNYADAKTPIECFCKKCGKVWQPIPNSLTRGKGCPQCGIASRAKKRRLPFNEFKSRVLENNPDLEILDEEYKNKDSYVLVKCKKCGHIWNALASTLLYDKGTCENCFNFLGKTTESFKEELSTINPYIEVLGEYRNTETKIKCRCKICQNEWDARPTGLLKGKGCKECCHTGTSYTEQFLLLYLRELHGRKAVLSRDKKSIGKELDIYLPEKKLAIEPGAWELHSEKLQNDLEKYRRCKKAGIQLIIIYFLCPLSHEMVIEKMGLSGDSLKQNIYVYKNNPATEKDYSSLLSMINHIQEAMNDSVIINESKIKEINMQAYLKSRKRTTEDFIQLMKEVTPTIEVLDEYTRRPSSLTNW